MLKVHLMCIDAQNDFCDPNGSLFVRGGDQNVGRTAAMVDRLLDKLSEITTTMDSHRKIDISHPMWFVDEHGKHPAPFTLITPADVESGRWRTTQVSARNRNARVPEGAGGDQSLPARDLAGALPDWRPGAQHPPDAERSDPRLGAEALRHAERRD
jgi:hypothetical protein